MARGKKKRREKKLIKINVKRGQETRQMENKKKVSKAGLVTLTYLERDMSQALKARGWASLRHCGGVMA